MSPYTSKSLDGNVIYKCGNCHSPWYKASDAELCRKSEIEDAKRTIKGGIRKLSKLVPSHPERKAIIYGIAKEFINEF